jgi:hypothetical protein
MVLRYRVRAGRIRTAGRPALTPTER